MGRQRWASKAMELAKRGFVEGRGHARVLSGEILWCRLCGAYANDSAKGLAQPCPGPFRGSWQRGPGPFSRGRRQQLSRLRDGKHPMSCAPLPAAIAEHLLCDGSASGQTGPDRASMLRRRQADLSAPSRFEALRQRILAKERASSEAGKASAKVKKRLRVKTFDPSWHSRGQ